MTFKTFNQWFMSLPPEKQKLLREDKWMLAEAAFDAALNQPKQKETNREQVKAV